MLSDKIQLKTPLRVTWDLRGEKELDQNLAAMYSMVKGAFLFEFNLIVNGHLLTNGCEDFWKSNCKSFPEVNLIIASDFDCSLTSRVNGYTFRLVVVDWSSLQSQAAELFSSIEGKKAVQFIMSRANLSRLGELIDLCKERKVQTLIFSNPNLLNSQCEDFLIDSTMIRDGMKQHSEKFKQLEETCQIKMHDLFSEEILLGKGRREGNYAGCQAGLYLAYVDAGGNVYGCASLPMVIGNLQAASWEEIWQSDKRKSLRNQLAVRGTTCRNCNTYNYCKGGCRGLSWIKHGNFTEPDILCEVVA